MDFAGFLGHRATIASIMISTTLTALSLIAMSPAGAIPGEKLPKGAPWHVTYPAARRDALRNGRPIFVYFTKTY